MFGLAWMVYQETRIARIDRELYAQTVQITTYKKLLNEAQDEIDKFRSELAVARNEIDRMEVRQIRFIEIIDRVYGQMNEHFRTPHQTPTPVPPPLDLDVERNNRR